MIWRAIEGATTASRATPSAVTIGTFDGVHRGHQQLVSLAVAAGTPAVAVTFDPHPVEVFAPAKAPLRLTSIERRVALLKDAGADEVRVLAFDKDMASWSPDQFIERILVAELHASAVIVGENFTFGSRASGNCDVLREAGERIGFAVDEISLLGGEPPWSSTRVRAAIAEGEMRVASDILGRPHAIEGVVSLGQQRGRELGFPTANVPVDDRFAVPPDGVYATWFVRASGDRLPAATSVGTNPTFGEHDRRVEAYVLDREGLDLYGESVRIEFVERLRGMETFDGVEPLIAQMNVDVERTRAALTV